MKLFKMKWNPNFSNLRGNENWFELGWGGGIIAVFLKKRKQLLVQVIGRSVEKSGLKSNAKMFQYVNMFITCNVSKISTCSCLSPLT